MQARGPHGDDDIADAQTWKIASVTAAQAAFTAYYDALALLTAGSTNVDQLVNVSYYQGFASSQNPITGRWKNLSTPRATPIVDTITSHTVHTNMASQRRRNLN